MNAELNVKTGDFDGHEARMADYWFRNKICPDISRETLLGEAKRQMRLALEAFEENEIRKRMSSPHAPTPLSAGRKKKGPHMRADAIFSAAAPDLEALDFVAPLPAPRTMLTRSSSLDSTVGGSTAGTTTKTTKSGLSKSKSARHHSATSLPVDEATASTGPIKGPRAPSRSPIGRTTMAKKKKASVRVGVIPVDTLPLPIESAADEAAAASSGMIPDRLMTRRRSGKAVSDMAPTVEGVIPVGAAPPARPRRSKRSSLAEVDDTSFLMTLPINGNGVFADNRRTFELRIVRGAGSTAKDLREEVLKTVNRQTINGKRATKRSIKQIYLHSVVTIDGKESSIPVKNDHILEDHNAFEIVVSEPPSLSSSGPATLTPKRSRRGSASAAAMAAAAGAQDDGGENRAPEAEGGDAPAAPLEEAPQGPPRPPPPIKPGEIKLRMKALLRRFQSFLEAVDRRAAPSVHRPHSFPRESENPNELAEIFAAMEKLVPSTSKTPRGDSHFGEADDTDIDGDGFDPSNPASIIRAAGLSLHAGLGIAYAKSSDPNTLVRLARNALDRRRNMAAMSLVRNGPRGKPKPIDDEKLNALYPRRDRERDKHAATSIPVPDPKIWADDPSAPFHLAREVFDIYLNQKPMGTARGMLGPSWDNLKSVTDDGDEGSNVLFEIIKLLAPEKLQRKFTADEKSLFYQGRGIAIDKDDGGVRPIGILNALATLANAVMLRMIEEGVTKACMPNLGYGVPGASEALPRMVEKALLNPDWIAVSLDVENAFNSIEHDVLLKAVIKAAEDDPSLRVLARHAFNMYANGVPFKVTFTCPVDVTKQLAFQIERGVIQGSASGSVLFILAVNRLLETFRVDFPATRVNLFPYSDDHTMAGLVDNVLLAFPAIRDAFRRGGLNLKAPKTKVSGLLLDSAPIRARIAATLGIEFPADYARERHDIWTLCGVPLGHPSLVQSVLSAKIDNLIKSVRVLLAAAALPDKADFSIMQILRLFRVCVSPAATHLTRALEPSISKPHCSRLDAEIIRAVFATMGLEPLLKGSPANGSLARFIQSPSFDDHGSPVGLESMDKSVLFSVMRILLPQSLGGLGVPSLAGLADANYLASTQLTAHLMPLLAPQTIAFVDINGAPAPTSPLAAPGIGPLPLRFPVFAPGVMETADQSRLSLLGLTDEAVVGGSVTSNFPLSVKASTLYLTNLDVNDVPSEPLRAKTQEYARIPHHNAYLRLYEMMSEEQRIAMKCASGTAASAWLRAPLAIHKGRPTNGISDQEFAVCLKYLLGLPFSLDVAVPSEAAPALPCTKCGRGLTLEHSLSCTTKHKGVNIHNNAYAPIVSLARQAYHGQGVDIQIEPLLKDLYPMRSNYPDPSRPEYNSLRADVAVIPAAGVNSVNSNALVVDLTISAANSGKYRTRPDYSAPTLKAGEVKTVLDANAGLCAVPSSDRLRGFLPGTGPYPTEKITTSNFVAESSKVTHYINRCEGMDCNNFYAVTIDTHGAMNPRGRQLIRKLSQMAEETQAERGVAPKRWWMIADAVTTSISVALQRGVAKRILLAQRWCQREALRHSNPSGAFGAPTTQFAAVKEIASKPALVPGAIWTARETPLTKVVKRGPNSRSAAKRAAGVAAQAVAAAGGGEGEE